MYMDTINYNNNAEKHNNLPNLFLFDLDHTLIPIDSDQQWGQFLAKIGAVESINYAKKNEFFYEQYKLGKLDIDTFLAFGLSTLAKYSRAELLIWQAQFINEIIKPHITSQAMNLLYNMRKRAK